VIVRTQRGRTTVRPQVSNDNSAMFQSASITPVMEDLLDLEFGGATARFSRRSVIAQHRQRCLQRSPSSRLYFAARRGDARELQRVSLQRVVLGPIGNAIDAPVNQHALCRVTDRVRRSAHREIIGE